jgi:hypothetical protein
MNTSDATFQALGYAWAYEDATGKRTWSTEEHPTGSMAFATAYAQGWQEYNDGRRGMMTNLRDAYSRWQATGPDKPTIWSEYDQNRLAHHSGTT